MFVSLVSALYDVSAIVMSAIKYITDLGVPMWLSLTTYGSIGTSLMLGSLFLYKSRAEDMLSDKGATENSIQNQESSEQIQIKNNEIKSESEHETVNEGEVLTDSKIDLMKTMYEKFTEERFPTLQKCMLSPEYLIQVLFFIILSFRFSFFLAQMSSQLKYLFPTQLEVVDYLLSVSNIFFLGSLFISPIFGILLDKYQRYTFQYLSEDSNISSRTIYNKINACFFPPSCICCLATIMASSLLFISSKYSFYVVFICITITRSLLFSLSAAYTFSAFPKKFFGTLLGSVFLMSGFINLSQQFIIQFASPNSHPDLVNYILLGMCVATFVYPVYLKLKK